MKRHRGHLVPVVVLLLVLAWAPTASAQSPNPLFFGLERPGKELQASSDPGVAFVGGQFLVTSSRGERLRTSPDLRSWREDQLLIADPPGWAKGGQVASSQIYALPSSGEAYVLIFGALHKRLGKFCIGRAVSDNPFGFRADAEPIVCGPRRGGKSLYSLKDPSLSFNLDSLFLVYKREFQNHIIPSRRRPSDIAIRPIGNDARTGLGSHPVRLVVAERGRGEGKSVEAPTLIPYNGRFFLFYSIANYKTDSYGVSVAVSRQGPANTPMGGNYKKFDGNPIYSGRPSPSFCGVGHQDVVPPTRPGGIWRLFAHAYVVERLGTGPFNRCAPGRGQESKPKKRQLVSNPLFWDVKTNNRNFKWPRAGVNKAPTGDGVKARGTLTPPSR